MTTKEFEDYLKSIGGLVNGYYVDKPNITSVTVCECDNGWLQLIKNCIQELIDIGWDKQICQIKEKFGRLRFYPANYPEGSSKIIEKYSEISSHTCEVCGKEGELRNLPWIQTLCEKHYNEVAKKFGHGQR